MTSSNTTVSAPIEKVWQTLLDAETWEKWNPNQRLHLEHIEEDGHGTLLQREDSESDWRSSDITFESVDGLNYTLSWHRGLPFILDQRETYTLTKINDHETLMTHERRYYGVLSAVPELVKSKYLAQMFHNAGVGLKAFLE